MKPAVWILVYLALGVAVIAGGVWWLGHGRAVAAARVAASPGFAYPTVTPPAGGDPADWKAGHLDGWKWCVRHIRDGAVARDDAELRGFCPPDANRTAAFLAGYHDARERFDVLVASEGPEGARAEVLRQLKTKPRINDLRVVAPPP